MSAMSSAIHSAGTSALPSMASIAPSQSRHLLTPCGTELEASLTNLKISTSAEALSPAHSPAPGTKSSKSKRSDAAAVADSWEDEASDSAGGTETEPDADPAAISSPINALRKGAAAEGPFAPPPTPASPTHFGSPAYGGGGSSIDARFAAATAAARSAGGGVAGGSSSSSTAGGPPERRPEKTTAVAARMIAAGIGSRAPRRTEEEREYDRVTREKERKRRDKEREEAAAAKEREESAKKAVWDD